MQSEKNIEKNLRESIKKLGGWSLKLTAIHISGLPDRLCLLPGGVLFFAELKSEGKKPTKIQEFTHRKLTKLGFKVFVIDSNEKLKEIISLYERE